MFVHLRAKLTVLYAALFLLTLSGIAAAVYVTADRNVETSARDQLTASGAAFDNLLASRTDALADKAAVLSKDFGFRAALASGDTPTVHSALANLASRLGIDLAFVINTEGQVTAQYASGRDVILPGDVLKAVQGDDPITGLFPLHGRPYDLVSIPVLAPSLVGWVVFATPFDSAAMARLDQLSAIRLQASVIGRRPGQPWTGFGSRAVMNSGLHALIERAAGKGHVERIKTGGDTLALVHRLPTLGGGDEVLLLRYPMAEALKPYNSLFQTILALGLAGVILVVIGSWVIARGVTRPLSLLEDAAKRLQRGEVASLQITTKDEIGRLGETFNTMADEIYRRELSIKQARDDAQVADRAKGEFLANINHEFRTPLNGVLGSASVLATTDLASPQRGMVDLIQRSGNSLLHLLDGVLDLVELGSGAIQLQNDPFEFSAILAAAVEAIRPAAQVKGLLVHQDLGGMDGVWLKGDARRVTQILTCLLDNAIKFTEFGSVTLLADHDVEGDGWFVEVRDTGIGFDQARAEDLFGAFRQADGGMTRPFGGAGLGLSVSRDLARAMGGDIVAEGEPGRGARFRLTAPLETAEPLVQPQPVAPPQHFEGNDEEPASVRVLLAEDNPANRMVVELILSAVGAEVVSAENGAEAVEAFQTQAFDVVLMDLQMPVMDGLTAIVEIRRHETAAGHAPTPIIVLSANMQTMHLQASKAAGATLHLAKPIVSGTLIGALEDVLNPSDDDVSPNYQDARPAP